MDIGSLIRAERKSKGKTLREITDALAISQNSLWNLEKRNHGTMSGLERVCQFLGVEWIGLPLGSSLGNRIWAERLRRGWTQELVANKAGISRPAVIRVESDRGNISSLCAVLDVIAPDFRPRKPGIRQPDDPTPSTAFGEDLNRRARLSENVGDRRFATKRSALVLV
jgi:transcriptional regulator with XRE-family HTH domain